MASCANSLKPSASAVATAGVNVRSLALAFVGMVMMLSKAERWVDGPMDSKNCFVAFIPFRVPALSRLSMIGCAMGSVANSKIVGVLLDLVDVIVSLSTMAPASSALANALDGVAASLCTVFSSTSVLWAASKLAKSCSDGLLV